MSYTEYEYRYAIDSGKPTVALVLSDAAIDQKHRKLKAKATDAPDRVKKFREFVMTKMVKIVENEDQIKLAIMESIQTIQKHHKLTGWTRVTNDSKNIAKELARLTAENARLAKELTIPRTISNKSDYAQWERTLKDIKVPTKSEYAKRLENPSHKWSKSITLLEAMTDWASELAAGVTNSFTDNTPERRWLYLVAKHLLSLNLAEFGKTPADVSWNRIQLAKNGKQIVTELRHLTSARGQPNVADERAQGGADAGES